MSVIIKNLGKATIINTTAQTPGPPAGKSWLIKSIILTNRDSSARTMDVKVVINSVPAYIAPPSMSIAASSTTMIDTEITLQNPVSPSAPETLSLQVLTTPSPGVDYVLNGVERDL